MTNPRAQSTCPCGQAQPYHQCCQPLHQQQAWPITAEQLMRSRFCAFVFEQWQYLYDTGPQDDTSADTQTALAQWSSDKTWLSLRVLSTRQGTDADQHGEVEFVAFFRDGAGLQQHHEHSMFARDQHSHWQFLDGHSLPAITLGRNEPCPCLSGKKFKRCCAN